MLYNREMPVRRTAFLDRDGVINRVPPSGHLCSPDEFEFLPCVPAACHMLIEKGFDIVVVTNQGGIARGYYTMDDYLSVNHKMLSLFHAEGIEILDVFFSPYHPVCDPKYAEFREWRKPAAGMMFAAREKYGIHLPDSILVGDMESDIEAANNAGISGIFLIGSEKTPPKKDFSFQVRNSLIEVAEGL